MRACLDVFARMLAESRFDPERRSMGLEIELNLTDEAGDPAMLNAAVLEAIADNDFTTELAQFNVEINIPPRLLDGAVFSELEEQVRASLNAAEDKSRERRRAHDARGDPADDLRPAPQRRGASAPTRATGCSTSRSSPPAGRTSRSRSPARSG